MTRNKIILKSFLPALLILCFNLSACRHNQIINYPNFLLERLKVDSVCFIADTEVNEFAVDDFTSLEKAAIQRNGRELINHAAKLMADKGYTISKMYNPTINAIYDGRLMIKRGYKLSENDIKPYRKNKRRIDRNIKKDIKLYAYLNPRLRDTSLIEIFPNYSVPVDTSVKPSDFSKMDVLVLISIGAVYANSDGIQLTSDASSQKHTKGYKKGFGMLRVWLIDRKTRKILWHEKSVNYGIINSYKNNLELLLENIPVRKK